MAARNSMDLTSQPPSSRPSSDMPRLSLELQGFIAERINHDPVADGEVAGPPPTTNANCRSSLTYGRNICIAVGEDCCTEKVLKYAARYIIRGPDNVTLVHMSKTSIAPEAASILAKADAAQQQQSGKSGAAAHDAEILLHAKATLLKTKKVKADKLSLGILPAGKNVGQALVDHCLKGQYDILVMGSRGISTRKSKLLSFMGEGSVSSYCAEHLSYGKLPLGTKRPSVVVVKPPQEH